jgi:hypothetical protein
MGYPSFVVFPLSSFLSLVEEEEELEEKEEMDALVGGSISSSSNSYKE